MRIINFNNEDTIGKIARRAYHIEAGHDEDLVRRAERALLESNPHLERLDNVRRGTTILVPEVRGLRPSKRVKPLAVPASSGLADLAGALDQVQEMMAEVFRDEIADADAAARMAAGRRLRNQLEDDALIERLDEIVANAKEASKQAKVRRKEFAQALAAAQKDLSALMKKLT